MHIYIYIYIHTYKHINNIYHALLASPNQIYDAWTYSNSKLATACGPLDVHHRRSLKERGGEAIEIGWKRDLASSVLSQTIFAIRAIAARAGTRQKNNTHRQLSTTESCEYIAGNRAFLAWLQHTSAYSAGHTFSYCLSRGSTNSNVVSHRMEVFLASAMCSQCTVAMILYFNICNIIRTYNNMVYHIISYIVLYHVMFYSSNSAQ